MKPLIKKCEEPSYNKPSYGPPKEPKMVCKTWFESVCNTTYALSKGAAPDANLKPQTWCQKEPRKICAPDYCEVVEGPEECHDKTLTSTIGAVRFSKFQIQHLKNCEIPVVKTKTNQPKPKVLFGNFKKGYAKFL